MIVEQNTDEITFTSKTNNKFKQIFELRNKIEKNKLLVRQNGLNLKYIINQTDEICELAVQRNGSALEYVINQTDKICKLAVQRNGLALKYVINQTDEI